MSVYGWAVCRCSIWRIVKFQPLKDCGLCHQKCQKLSNEYDEFTRANMEEVAEGLNVLVKGGK